MKRSISALLLLGLSVGVVEQADARKQKLPPEPEAPADVVPLQSNNKHIYHVYHDFRTITSYKDNNQLRQLYIIQNYPDGFPLGEKKKNALSVRGTMVVNCESSEWAIMEWQFYSDYFAQGQLMHAFKPYMPWQEMHGYSVIERACATPSTKAPTSSHHAAQAK